MPHRVLVHYHIFKNAGSSVDEALREAFGDRWASFEGRHAHDVQSADQLRAFLELRPHLRAVSSHLAARATREHLERAQALSGWGVFGIVEDFERSAGRMRERFAPIFPEFRFTTHWANRTREQRTDLQRDIGGMREELGSTLFEWLVEANWRDLELYEFARRVAAKVSLGDDNKR